MRSGDGCEYGVEMGGKEGRVCSNLTSSSWIEEAQESRSQSETQSLSSCERYMALVIRWRSVEDREASVACWK